MVIELPMWGIACLNALGWPVIQVGLAWAFTRMPEGWFASAPEAAAWEREGEFYTRWCGIRHWKDRLPDAAGWFGGGFAKRHLGRPEPEHLRRFIVETWRGELCHWSALAFVPVFFLWNPWWGDLVIVAYALAANLPCILAQRHNRPRLRRMLRMRTKKENGTPHEGGVPL